MTLILWFIWGQKLCLLRVSEKKKWQVPEVQFCILGDYCKFYPWSYRLPKFPPNHFWRYLGKDLACGWHFIALLLQIIKLSCPGSGARHFWPHFLRLVNLPRSFCAPNKSTVTLSQFSLIWLIAWAEKPRVMEQKTYYSGLFLSYFQFYFIFCVLVFFSCMYAKFSQDNVTI